MSLSVGPITLDWKASGTPTDTSHGWTVEYLDRPPAVRGPQGARWFNDDEWSGVETSQWLAWISNISSVAAVWSAVEKLARRDALAVVIPAVLRRQGLLDGHGAVIAPDKDRPDDAIFVTGLSGSGKSSLTVACALGGGRFVSDDSVAIGQDQTSLRAWARRSLLSLSPEMFDRFLPEAAGSVFEGKRLFDARTTFERCFVDSQRVLAVAFLEGATPPDEGIRGGPERTVVSPIEPAEGYRRLLMGHPILALDRGARPCFQTVRALSDLPCYSVTRGRDLLDPATACKTLASLLPKPSPPRDAH